MSQPVEVKLTPLGARLLKVSAEAKAKAFGEAKRIAAEADGEHARTIHLLIREHGHKVPANAEIKSDERADGTYLLWAEKPDTTTKP